MSEQPRLHHLLDRARRGVLLPAEGEQLAGLVGELEAENAQLRDGLAHCRHKPRVTELEAEVARLHEGEEPHPDERMTPTPTQWLWLWNRATPAKRLKVAAQVMDDAARAGRCFMGDHEKTIDHYRRRAERAEDEVARLTAGQCTDSRRMCDLHHTVPVDGCPYPKRLAAQTRQENADA